MASEAEELGRVLGASPTTALRPHIDTNSVAVSASALTLHDGEVPIRLGGLGSRRLLALAVQLKLAETQGITLIDEVEHGLEPYRVRHLVRTLNAASGQTFMATHSSVALGEVDIGNVVVVRRDAGLTTLRVPRSELGRFIHKNPESFLARRVLVCEGKTEMGLCRGLDQVWSAAGKDPFACTGVAIANGGGSEQGEVAHAFRELGYEVALLCDSDSAFTPSPHQLRAAGVTVIQWADDLALEQRLARDLPLESVMDMVRMAIARIGVQPVRDKVSALVGMQSSALGDDPANWLDSGAAEPNLRDAIGKAAKDKGWFKQVELAVPLVTEVLNPVREQVRGTDLDAKLSALQAWLYGQAA